jgi:hypothetical protein
MHRSARFEPKGTDGGSEPDVSREGRRSTSKAGLTHGLQRSGEGSEAQPDPEERPYRTPIIARPFLSEDVSGTHGRQQQHDEPDGSMHL